MRDEVGEGRAEEHAADDLAGLWGSGEGAKWHARALWATLHDTLLQAPGDEGREAAAALRGMRAGGTPGEAARRGGREARPAGGREAVELSARRGARQRGEPALIRELPAHPQGLPAGQGGG